MSDQEQANGLRNNPDNPAIVNASVTLSVRELSQSPEFNISMTECSRILG